MSVLSEYEPWVEAGRNGVYHRDGHDRFFAVIDRLRVTAPTEDLARARLANRLDEIAASLRSNTPIATAREPE